MAKRATKEQTKSDRAARASADNEEAAKKNAPARKARDIRNETVREQVKKSRLAAVEAAAAEDEADSKKKGTAKVHLHDGKPGSGAGLKPGDLHAPKSNPGAAAPVPSQPLQPESLQSHGKGILYDKDLDNPPYDVGDPAETDASPAGSVEGRVDKKAERQKAEKATARSKQADPDNPAIGARGKKDATASPNPIGSSASSKNAVAGGSNPGIEP